ncbi:hypothetical protein ILYODFUR_037297 [Ilyodon furcidens]|uniref:Uncharacterized protein n=1 Tax=Ilyodon furcidens TaxID=33524 RepID=A0ABV0TT01_9TELE
MGNRGVHTLRAAGSNRRDGTPFGGRSYATVGRNCLPYSSLGPYALDTLIDVRWVFPTSTGGLLWMYDSVAFSNHLFAALIKYICPCCLSAAPLTATAYTP